MKHEMLVPMSQVKVSGPQRSSRVQHHDIRLPELQPVDQLKLPFLGELLLNKFQSLLLCVSFLEILGHHGLNNSR